MAKLQPIQTVDINGLFSILTEEVRRAVKEEVKHINTPPKKELLKPSEAAKEYGMSEGYWRKLIFNQAIPFTKMGKAVRLRRSDIESFIENNKIEK